MKTYSHVTHIVVAGGTGSRFGAQLPKQYCLLHGRPVVMHAIDALRRATPGSEVIIVISEPMRGLWGELCEAHGFDSPQIAYGGATRWESVKNGLKLVGAGCRIVTVHDAARPLVEKRVVVEAVEAVETGAQGAVPVVPVTDSLRLIDADDPCHGKAVDRRRYVAVQTPQAFDRSLLHEAYLLPYIATFTDDASVMEAAGYTDLRLTGGSPDNIKITNPNDLKIAELLLSGDE